MNFPGVLLMCFGPLYAPSTPVVQFATELFKVVGYVGGDRIGYKWMDLLWQTKASKVRCLYYRNEVVLAAQEHKMTEFAGLDKARIQLVARAVAAFNHNNLQRKKTGLPPLEEKASYFVSMPTLF